VRLNVAAEEPYGGFHVFGLVIEEYESAEGGEMFILAKIIDGLSQHAAKNFNSRAQCEGMERICEYRHSFFLSVVVVDGEEKAGPV
jgi:hypothetical protein